MKVIIGYYNGNPNDAESLKDVMRSTDAEEYVIVRGSNIPEDGLGIIREFYGNSVRVEVTDVSDHDDIGKTLRMLCERYRTMDEQCTITIDITNADSVESYVSCMIAYRFGCNATYLHGTGSICNIIMPKIVDISRYKGANLRILEILYDSRREMDAYSLAEQTGYGRQTVINNLGKLRHVGLIETEGRRNKIHRITESGILAYSNYIGGMVNK